MHPSIVRSRGRFLFGLTSSSHYSSRAALPSLTYPQHCFHGYHHQVSAPSYVLVVYRYTQPTTSPLCPAMYRRRISRTTFMRPALPLSHMICGSLSTARHSPTRHPCAGACPVSRRPDSLQACPSTDTRPPSRVPHGLLSCRRTADSRARRLT